MYTSTKRNQCKRVIFSIACTVSGQAAIESEPRRRSRSGDQKKKRFRRRSRKEKEKPLAPRVILAMKRRHSVLPHLK